MIQAFGNIEKKFFSFSFFVDCSQTIFFLHMLSSMVFRYCKTHTIGALLHTNKILTLKSFYACSLANEVS